MGCQISWLSWPFTWVTKFSSPTWVSWLSWVTKFDPRSFPAILSYVIRRVFANIRKLHPATYVGIVTWNSGVLDLVSLGKLLVAFIVPCRIFAGICTCGVHWIPTLYWLATQFRWYCCWIVMPMLYMRHWCKYYVTIVSTPTTQLVSIIHVTSAVLYSVKKTTLHAWATMCPTLSIEGYFLGHSVQGTPPLGWTVNTWVISSL